MCKFAKLVNVLLHYHLMPREYICWPDQSNRSESDRRLDDRLVKLKGQIRTANKSLRSRYQDAIALLESSISLPIVALNHINSGIKEAEKVAGKPLSNSILELQARYKKILKKRKR